MAVEACWTCMRRNILVANSLRFVRNSRFLHSSGVLRYTEDGVNAERTSQQDQDNSFSVAPEVAKILEDSRPKFVNNNWHKPKISARRLAELRKSYISQGYFWPQKPLVDRSLDRKPKGHRYEREKEARLAKIEENMKNMPRIIEEYRKKMRELRAKRKDERKASNVKALEAKRLGVHPKDPRGLAAIGQEDKKTKHKFQKKTK